MVGSGGREHALAHVLARSAEVVCTPGNPGIEEVAFCTPAPAEAIDADLYVIGPEAPLVDGLADRLRAQGRLVFGPGADGARLEGSKAWMKEVLASAGVPTAAHAAFGADEEEAAVAFLRTLPGLYVVKTDGLAAGKGVLVTTDLAEAIDDVRAKLAGSAFGEAGRTVVIEEGLAGPELSVLAVCDGQRAVPLAPAQDFKRAGDGDAGPNTGGMGAYSPVPGAGADVVELVMTAAVEPTLAALRSAGIDYRGVLYAGLMLTAEGPKVLEFNVRFGDPEAEVVLPRLADDLAELLHSAAEGRLGARPPAFSPGACVTVVLAAEGYPTHPRAGDVIVGVEAAAEIPGVAVYHAGTRRDDDGRLVTAGGRVLAVTGQGADLASARRVAYLGADTISWAGRMARRDIAEHAAVVASSLSSSASASASSLGVVGLGVVGLVVGLGVGGPGGGGRETMSGRKVAVLMGSANDQPKMAPALEMLAEFGVQATEHVLSAHRTPAAVTALASTARENGYGVIICAAGMAAHLAGAVAAQTTLPVVGVPLSGGGLNGVDALYSTVQMPRGIPVATVAIDGAVNAAVLAVEMLAITDAELAGRLSEFRSQWNAP